MLTALPAMVWAGTGIGIGGWTDGNKYAQTEGDYTADSLRFVSSAPDENAVAIMGGTFHMTACGADKTGTTAMSSATTAAHQGINSACYCGGNAALHIQGGSITATGTATCGVAAYMGGFVALEETHIRTQGAYACGLVASYGAVIEATNTTITTIGPSTPTLLMGKGRNIILLTDCQVEAESGVLLRAERSSTSTTKGADAHLLLKSASTCTYTGKVEADSYSHVCVTVGKGVTWRLTGDCTVDTLLLDGDIDYNGYTLTANHTTTSGIRKPRTEDIERKGDWWFPQGTRAKGGMMPGTGLVVGKGKKILRGK